MARWNPIPEQRTGVMNMVGGGDEERLRDQDVCVCVMEFPKSGVSDLFL